MAEFKDSWTFPCLGENCDMKYSCRCHHKYIEYVKEGVLCWHTKGKDKKTDICECYYPVDVRYKR